MSFRIIYILFIFFIIFSNNVFANDIYETNFHHINTKTDDATKTKLNEIKKIKIESLEKILNKILLDDDRNFLIKNLQYDKILSNTVKNIIIENEIITSNKYIADIKVNFYKNEIINLLRNYKLNYSDLISSPFLIISSYTGEFIKSGLTDENIFYKKEFLEKIDNYNYSINLIYPNLNSNDRFILPYNKIIKDDIKSLNKISKKYKTNNIFVIKVSKIIDSYNLKIYFFSNSSNDIQLINEVNLINSNNLNEYSYNYLNNWWKKNNLINNSIINNLTCEIKSKDFYDLKEIKSILSNLSQIKTIELLQISYNKNIENILYYGDYNIFLKSIEINNLLIDNTNKCIITNKIS